MNIVKHVQTLAERKGLTFTLLTHPYNYFETINLMCVQSALVLWSCDFLFLMWATSYCSATFSNLMFSLPLFTSVHHLSLAMIREASPSMQLRKKPSDASQSDAFTPKSPKRANRSQWLDLEFSVDVWSQCECGTGGELLKQTKFFYLLESRCCPWHMWSYLITSPSFLLD